MTERVTEQLSVGDVVADQTYWITRENLVRYAGASGDFNPIHWRESFAKAVGLPDVIAHGMYTMAQGGRFVTDWVGDPGAVVDYGVRFSSPVVVPDEGGASLVISGKVEEKLDDGKVVVALTARSNDQKVLTRAKAVVRLA